MLTAEEKRGLIDEFNQHLQNIYFDIHAIYEPDGDGIFGDCYCAAVNLFSPFFTFRLYFRMENGKVKMQDGRPVIEHIERWHFG